MNSLKRKKNWFCRLVSALVCLLAWSTGCAHTANYESRNINSELNEQKHVKQLVVVPAPADVPSSSTYKIKVMEDAMVDRQVREKCVVSVKSYPFSAARKFDEIVLGTLGAPFSPLAILGGIADGDPELMLFPISALWPFRNFKPNKSALFSLPVPPTSKEHTTFGEWKSLPPARSLQPVLSTQITVYANDKKFEIQTDGDGVASLDLLRIEPLGDITCWIHTPNGLYCSHTLKYERLLAAHRQPKAQPEVAKPVPERLAMEPQPPAAVKIPPRVPTPSAFPSWKALQLDRHKFYKVSKYGYLVNEAGFAIISLPAHPDVEVYADESLKNQIARRLSMQKGQYVFQFSFDKASNILLAAKVGETPQESDAFGWVSAQDLYFWDTIYRLKMTQPIAMYPTYDSCLQGDSKMAKMYDPATSKTQIFPVLAKKGQNWCIAFPTFMNGERYHYGWIQWQDKMMDLLEVRVTKHKLDLALEYMENEMTGKQDRKVLKNNLQMEATGPLGIARVTGEMFFASFNREEQKQEKVVKTYIDIPADPQEYRKFQERILHISHMLMQESLWEGEDILYIPAQWIR